VYCLLFIRVNHDSTIIKHFSRYLLFRKQLGGNFPIIRNDVQKMLLRRVGIATLILLIIFLIRGTLILILRVILKRDTMGDDGVSILLIFIFLEILPLTLVSILLMGQTSPCNPDNLSRGSSRLLYRESPRSRHSAASAGKEATFYVPIPRPPSHPDSPLVWGTPAPAVVSSIVDFSPMKS
jgi:hypothetical protein